MADPTSRRWLWAALGVAALAILAATGGYVAWRHGAAPPPPPVELADVDPEVAEAIEAARAAVRRQPRSGEAWGRLGMVLYAHGCEAEAAVCFGHAEPLDPDNPRWPYYRALITLLDHPADGLRHLERAAAIDRDQFVPRLRLAEVLLENGQADEATRHFGKVLLVEPREPRANLGMAQVAFRNGDWATSRGHLAKAVAVAPGSKPVRALLAEIHFREGDQTAAAAQLAVLAKLPDNQSWPDPYLARLQPLRVGLKGRLGEAERLLSQGQTEAAVGRLREVVVRYPAAHQGHYMFAQLMLQAGKGAAAEAAAREAVRLNEAGVDQRYLLGLALAQQGKHGEAAAAFREVLRQQPGVSPARHRLGCCQRELGELEAAVASFRAAILHKPDVAEWHRDLGEVLARCKRDAEAIRALLDAQRLDPSDARTKELLTKLQKSG